MEALINVISPFLVKTTAIMSAVIILVLIGAFLVSTEKKINRTTVGQFIKVIRNSVVALILLEAFLTTVETVKIFIVH